MKLWTLSNYGETEKTVSEKSSADDIDMIMNSLDWSQFYQVILEKQNGDFLEVGGSLEEDGLSVQYQEGESQFVIVNPPATVNEMTHFLKLYLAGNDAYKTKYKFE